ncbi:hypothetical protein [Streptomyces minutiscleroticus]|uniref:hypothetical protein n=1 Tax=Streptomyces minutiscleroticus TaxID=68238 RepID=UPI003329A0A6
MGDTPVQVQPVGRGEDAGDVGGAGHVVRVALAGAAAALVEGDDPVAGTRLPGDGVPLPRVPGRPVRQEDGGTRPAPVPAGEPDAVPRDDGVSGPGRPGAAGQRTWTEGTRQPRGGGRGAGCP